MNTWKQAFWLAKFELKASIANIFLCWFILSILGFLFLTSFNDYLENNYAGFDIFFLLIFSYAPYWLRSSHFQFKKLSDHMYASPTLIMQIQLPIPKDALIKSRLIVYLAYLLPFMFTIFPIFYMMNSPIRDSIDIPTYLIFVLIWISYGLYFGIIVPASDTGQYITSKIMLYHLLIFFVIVMSLIVLFYLLFEIGIVAWTMMLAQDWALLTTVISIGLVILSWKFWSNQMKKTIKKLDYL